MSDDRRTEGEGAGGVGIGAAGAPAGGAMADATGGVASDAATAGGAASRETPAEARFVDLEIKLAELEFGQHQVDEVVLRQGDDIRRLSALVRQLGDRLETALGESVRAGESGPASAASARRPGDAGRGPDDGGAGERADPSVDPERPPHYSGPA